MGIRTGFKKVVWSIAIGVLASSLAHGAEKLRIATGGFSPSVPPFVSFALVVKDLAVQIEKAKTATVAELRMVDDSIRAELVKEGIFKSAR